MDANGPINGGQFRPTVQINGGGPPSGGKKMRKRKELDALVSHPSLPNAGKRLSLSRSRHTDQLLAESTDDEFYWSSSGREKSNAFGSTRSSGGSYLKRAAAKGERRRSHDGSWRFGFLRACSFMFVFTCIVATCSVLYLFLDIRQQCAYLRHELDEVVAGSQGVPDALQRCHSLSKQLERNQTELVTKFNSLAVQIRNFSIQIADLHSTIASVQAQLAASPQVLDVPARLKDLASNVAGFGSTLSDLSNTVTKVKGEGDDLRSRTQELAVNMTRLTESLELVRRQSQPGSDQHDLSVKLEASLGQLSTNLTRVNETLSARLNFLRDDQTKNHKNIEELQNSSVNVSTRLSSVQGDVTSLTTSLTSVSREVNALSASVGKLRLDVTRTDRNKNVFVDDTLNSSQLTTVPISTERGSLPAAAVVQPLPLDINLLEPNQNSAPDVGTANNPARTPLDTPNSPIDETPTRK